MGIDGAIDTGVGVVIFRPSGRGSGVVVGVGGREAGVENTSSKIIQGAKDARLHPDSGGAGVYGRRFGASYGGRWTLRLHTGENCPSRSYR